LSCQLLIKFAPRAIEALVPAGATTHGGAQPTRAEGTDFQVWMNDSSGADDAGWLASITMMPVDSRSIALDGLE
jgi:hypothetical protein